MTRAAILRWPDPRLSKVCAPATPGPDVANLARDLFETMYAAPGRGLAAPQIGVLLRVFVMDVTWKEGTPRPWVCINPKLRLEGDVVSSTEGCLSIPGLTTDVARKTRAVMSYTDLAGRHQRVTLTGAEAICAQHEADHLDGIVTFDRLSAPDRMRAVSDYEALP